MIESEKLKPHFICLSFFLILFCSCKQKKVTKPEKNENTNSKSIIKSDESLRKADAVIDINNNPGIEVSKSENMTQHKDSLSIVKLKRKIDGEEVLIEFSKDQEYNEYGQRVLWSQKKAGMEYPQEVKEISKGVVLYPRLTSYITPHGTLAESFRESWLEFFDEDYNLIGNYNIVKNNPFLNDTIPDAKLTEYFYNKGEGYTYLTDKNKRKRKIISDQWVYAQAKTQNSLTIIKYRRLLASQDGYIVGSHYHFKVLDRLGNVISEMDSHYDQLTGVTFSPDGRAALLAYTQGETTNSDGIKNASEGFEIWDLSKNELIYIEVNEDPNMRISSPNLQVDDGFIKVRYTFPNSKEISNLLVLYDFQKQSIFKYKFSTIERNEVSLNWFKKYKSYRNLMNYYKFKEEKL